MKLIFVHGNKRKWDKNAVSGEFRIEEQIKT